MQYSLELSSEPSKYLQKCKFCDYFRLDETCKLGLLDDLAGDCDRRTVNGHKTRRRPTRGQESMPRGR